MKSDRIVRPKKGRMIAGVAIGIANYFGIDPIIIRLVFVILTIWGGAGILIYIIGIFIIPEDDEKVSDKDSQNKKVYEERISKAANEAKDKLKLNKSNLSGEQIAGLIILIVGIIALMNVFMPAFNSWRFWPLLIIVIGIILLVRSKNEKNKENK